MTTCLDQSVNQNIDLKPRSPRSRETCFFREECLPAFLGGSAKDFFMDGLIMSDWHKDHIVTLAGKLSEWRQATNRLADFLPLGPLAVDAPRLDRQDFTGFLFQQAETSFTCNNSRFIWKIGLYASLDIALLYYRQGKGISDETPVSFEESLPEIKRWLMSLEVDCLLFNSLCQLCRSLRTAIQPLLGLLSTPKLGGRWSRQIPTLTKKSVRVS